MCWYRDKGGCAREAEMLPATHGRARKVAVSKSYLPSRAKIGLPLSRPDLAVCWLASTMMVSSAHHGPHAGDARHGK